MVFTRRSLLLLILGLSGCGLEEEARRISKIYRNQTHQPEVPSTPQESPNEAGHCGPPVDWQTRLCVEAPSVEGRSFVRTNGAGENDYIWFHENGEVKFIVGSSRNVVTSCYQQQGGCLNIVNYWHGERGFLPTNHNFSVTRDGAGIRDEEHGLDFFEMVSCEL